MVSTLSIFSVALALALNMLFSSVVYASVSSSSSSSSPHSQRISAADGPFVRGLMAADSQLLYMTVSETNRGGGSVGPSDEEVEEKVDNNTPMMHVQRARETAINFADVVRRRAFSPVQSRQSVGRADRELN